jgi:succinate dehydrogenase iron-sulfur subunit
MKNLSASIYRYDPERDDKPRMQTYTLPFPERDIMVLDVLERLKETDSTLSFRRSCREGVCGSDGMNIGGKNGLACITPLSVALKRNPTLIVRPLPGMPVIRDLVVDLSLFFKQYEKVKPWLISDQPEPPIERLQTPEDRARLDGLYECILCACCTSSCPSWWWNPDRYIGPAGLLNALRFLEDSRDTAAADRLDNLQDPYSVFRCRDIQNCADVCPKGLNPMAAIGKIRTMLLKQS